MTIKAFNPRPLYDVYHVKLQVRDRICGGMPKNKELIRSWVEATTGHKDEKSEALTKEAMDLVVDETAEKSWITFPADAKGIFIEARQVKAMLKQSAQLLGITAKKRGSKQILAEGMEVKAMDGGARIYLGAKEPTGTHENAIHVLTAQGPRTALRRMDYIKSPLIEFEVWVLKTESGEKRHIGHDDLVAILTHSQENGLGASRSQGEGKHDVAHFEKVA